MRTGILAIFVPGLILAACDPASPAAGEPGDPAGEPAGIQAAEAVSGEAVAAEAAPDGRLVPSSLPTGWVFTPAPGPGGRPPREQPPVLEQADGLVPLLPAGAQDGPTRLFLACLVVTEGSAPGAATAVP